MSDIRQRMRLPISRLTVLSSLAAALWLVSVTSAQKKQIPASADPGGHSAFRTSQSAIATGVPRYQLLNINNLTTWHRSDGHSNHSPGADNGLYYPRGTGNVIYQDCIVWGGKVFRDAALTIPFSSTPVNQNIRVGGGTYGIGTRAGAVTGFGASALAEDPNGSNVRIYRIRRDYATMSRDDLLRDAASYYEHASVNDVSQSEMDQILTWYENDWTSWPVAKGAPFIDRNGNGAYEPPPPFNTNPAAGPLFTAESLMAQGWDEPGVVGGDNTLPADQVLWTVYNDLNETDATNFVGSRSIGLEVQKTVWGYNRTDLLGNFYYVHYVFINKGGVDTSDAPGMQAGSFWIDSMYVGQWSDPDIGSFSDDLIGVDTSLDLMFAYNANEVDATFRAFNIPPPSVGYDLLAGPVVSSPGDSAVLNLKRVYDKANLGPYAFSFLSAGSPWVDPPGGPYDYLTGTGRWWKMLRGYQPLGDLTTSSDFYTAPPGLEGSRFPLSGDPVARTGWIDGLGMPYSFVTGDRRFMLSTGPFRMAPGDTQEVYVAVIVGLGADRLSSISIVKQYDRSVQTQFDKLLRIPKPPAMPIVTAAELDREILLEWGSDQSRVFGTENDVIALTYTFEGYNVYQLPTDRTDVSSGVKLATYDLVNGVLAIAEPWIDPATGYPATRILQRGEDSGVQRSIRISIDKLADPTNRYARDPLVNGKEYRFAVTAYNRNTVAGPAPVSMESEPAIVTVKPRIPFGVQLTAEYGDTVSVTHTAGTSDGMVTVHVRDPLRVTGGTYTVSFGPGTDVKTVSISNVGGPARSPFPFAPNPSSYIVDGLEIVVENAFGAFKNFEVVSNGAGPLLFLQAGALAFQGFPTTGGGNPSGGQQVGSGMWAIHSSLLTGGSGTYEDFLAQVSGGRELWKTEGARDFEIRFTAAGGYGFAPDYYLDSSLTGGQLIPVPFELWCTGSGTPDDPSDDYRVWPYLTDLDSNGVFNLLQRDHPGSTGDNDPFTDSFSWIEPLDRTPGQSGYNAILASIQANPAGHRYLDSSLFNMELLRDMVFLSWNAGVVTDPSWPSNIGQLMPETGTIFRILTPVRLSSSDTYTFVAPSVNSGSKIIEESAKRVGVFPNPYYARNEWATSSLRPFVTFNNLPRKAVIRIFNLAGQLVRTLHKDSETQFFDWDLRNEHSWLVASGMYICLIEMPDLKLQRVLKLAVIQENPVPN